MNAVQEATQKVIAPNFHFKLGKNLYFSPSYVQAAAMVLLIFLLILSLARLRRMYVNWSMKGAVSMVALGFALAVIVEGFLIIGGRTMFTELIGWENTPKPISNMLNAGRERLVTVLGVSSEVPESKAKEKVDSQQVIETYEALPKDEAEEVYQFLCQP